MVDPAFISQVTNNILSNALHYTVLTITLIYEEQENRLLLSVEDNGKGFSKNALVKATKPYFTEEVNPSEHFGLGLYRCKILCEHHGGYLKLENAAAGAKVSAFFKALPL